MGNQSETLVPNNSSAAGAARRARANDPMIGMTVKDRYLIEKQIGTGGFGSVYLARDLELLSRPVVVKLLLEKSQQNESVRRKFRLEIEALARIHHPCVVSVLATGTLPDENPFIVMEYVEGASLRILVQERQEGMDLEHAANLIQQIGHALTAAHDKGIIHRDLKPENIMVCSLNSGDAHVKLIDFGIAKVKNAQLAASTAVPEMIGTVFYMAPEQLYGEPVTAATDIYSFGLIAYEMVTGRRAFNPSTLVQLAQIQHDGVKVKPTDLRPSLPKAVDDIILRALAYEPQARYQSASTFADDLYRSLTGHKGYSLAPTLPEASTLDFPRLHAAAVRKGRFTLIATGIVLMAILALGLALTVSVLFNSRTRSSSQVEPPSKTETLRSIDYYLMVQKHLPNGQPFQNPFRSTGNEILGDGWSFKVHISNSEAGYLYIVNEGPASEGVTYNLLYPSPRFNNGSAQVTSGENEIGSYGLDKNQGTEKFWLVWSVDPVTELEAVKGVVNPRDRGSISNPDHIEAIRGFLSTHWASKPEVNIDKTKKVVSVRSNSAVLVNLMELEHH